MPGVSIVIPVYNGARFIDSAVDGVLGQSFSDWELLLYDDGSTDDSRDICRWHAERDPRIRCLGHPRRKNRGQFATRVAAAEQANAELVALLDQDDVWAPDYLENHLEHWKAVAEKGVQLSYGPALHWHPEEPHRDYVQPMPEGAPGVFEPPDLLSSFFANHYAATPLPSCMLVRRDVLRAAARFAGSARGSQCEDQYLSWYVAARWPISIHSEAWVRYRQHEASALARMLAAPRRARTAELSFLRIAKAELSELHPKHPVLAKGLLDERIAELSGRRLGKTLTSLAPRLASIPKRLENLAGALGARPRLAFGVRPLSEAFGEERGRPLTRHYVEQFLAEHAADVRGRCLEFEGSDYTHRFGGSRVESFDVWHLDDSNPQATIVADLTKENHVPSNRYDCIIATFVLHEIFALEKAVRELHRLLKPGGTMLVAVPHVTMCEPRYNELWRFTLQGLGDLLSQTFGRERTELRAYGNSLTAAAQMRGLVAHEFTEAELEVHDPRFAVVICARVTKAPEAEVSAPLAIVRNRSASDGKRAVILMYHRIAEPAQDVHLLSVPPERFREHVDAVTQFGRPMQIGDLARGLANGTLPRRAVAITFDDGYADNLHLAKPILERYGVPATVFVTTGAVGSDREFWWDDVERLLLETPELPARLYVQPNGRRSEWSLGRSAKWTTEDLERYRDWNVLAPESPSERHRVFRALLDELRPLPAEGRRRAIEQLRSQIGTPANARPARRTLTASELVELQSGGLVEIGAHSESHARLSALDARAQQAEIGRSKAALEELLGRRIESFAYPYGGHDDYTPESMSIVQSLGFSSACSNFEGLVSSVTNPYELPRFMVMSWQGDELVERLEELFAEA